MYSGQNSEKKTKRSVPLIQKYLTDDDTKLYERYNNDPFLRAEFVSERGAKLQKFLKGVTVINVGLRVDF